MLSTSEFSGYAHGIKSIWAFILKPAPFLVGFAGSFWGVSKQDTAF